MKGLRTGFWTCSRCLRAQQRREAVRYPAIAPSRAVSSSTPAQVNGEAVHKDDGVSQEEKEVGALSRRLSEMAEETIDTGSKSDRKLIQEAGFSDELKKQLEERIAQTSFNTQNQQALSQANMPSYAGKGTELHAASQAWSGIESVEDAALRMLDDAHKKLRTPFRAPRIPQKVNLRPKPKVKVSSADRLVNARDKTSIYAFSQQESMSEQEREKLRKEMKERFTPGARPMPTTLQGLTSLANERIEDAIARGQFKNIPRGKGVNAERDHNANSPFLDTTEYFMNKIIQKQEIVPPWIEKQQELLKMTNSFRSRLRSDWRRHAARMISSTGGSVEEQVRRAKGYALAEEMVNPRQDNKASHSAISSDGNLVSVTMEDKIAAGVVEEIRQELKDEGIDVDIKVEEKNDTESASGTTTVLTPQPLAATSDAPSSSLEAPLAPSQPTANPSTPSTASSRSDSVLPTPYPFRDEDWLRIESAYHTLAISELNSFTRGYNLMAPKIAQKPYFTLDRELKRCYADVAPQLAEEILARSRAPKHIVGLAREREGILEKVVGEERIWKGHQGRIREEDPGKGYGWTEFWRDIWNRGGKREMKRPTNQSI